ncbi:hypothetical protein [Streptococcus dentiloxodontae]
MIKVSTLTFNDIINRLDEIILRYNITNESVLKLIKLMQKEYYNSLYSLLSMEGLKIQKSVEYTFRLILKDCGITAQITDEVLLCYYRLHYFEVLILRQKYMSRMKIIEELKKSMTLMDFAQLSLTPGFVSMNIETNVDTMLEVTKMMNQGATVEQIEKEVGVVYDYIPTRVSSWLELCGVRSKRRDKNLYDIKTGNIIIFKN